MKTKNQPASTVSCSPLSAGRRASASRGAPRPAPRRPRCGTGPRRSWSPRSARQVGSTCPRQGRLRARASRPGRRGARSSAPPGRRSWRRRRRGRPRRRAGWRRSPGAVVDAPPGEVVDAVGDEPPVGDTRGDHDGSAPRPPPRRRAAPPAPGPATRSRRLLGEHQLGAEPRHLGDRALRQVGAAQPAREARGSSRWPALARPARPGPRARS